MKRAKNYRKRSSAHSGHFGRLRRRREAFAAKVVQAIVMAILAASLVILEFAAIRLIRAHEAQFLAEYGGQAWLLPIAIGLIFCFIVYRWIKLWQEIKERLREMRDDGPEGTDTPV